MTIEINNRIDKFDKIDKVDVVVLCHTLVAVAEALADLLLGRCHDGSQALAAGGEG